MTHAVPSQLHPTAPGGKHTCPADRRRYVIASAVLASAMGFIDGTVVAVAIPQMRVALGADFTQAQWIANAYVLMLSALILVGGAAGDRFGTRRTFAVGIALFIVFSAFCALAESAAFLIAARALQGAGAAVMIPGSMALIAVNTPREERGAALGIWVAASSITTALGPLLGGVLITWGGDAAWRWIFAINVPVGALALYFLWWKVPADPPRRRRNLDVPGAALLTLALGGLAAGLTFLGEGNRSTLAWFLLAGGLVMALAAVAWERRAANPMLDLSLFRSRAFTGVNILTFLVWGSAAAVIFFLPMLIITGWKLPATYAGGVFVPFGIIIGVLSPLSGKMADRIGTRALLAIGPAAAAAGYLGLAWAIVQRDFWLGVVPAIVVIGIGFGISATPVSTAAVGAVDDGDAGAASGINNMFARMAALFAVAGLGAGLSAAYALVLRGSSLPAELQAMIIEQGFGERLTGALYQVATVDVQETAMDHAMIALCVVTATLSVAGALVGWFSLPKRLRRSFS